VAYWSAQLSNFVEFVRGCLYFSFFYVNEKSPNDGKIIYVCTFFCTYIHIHFLRVKHVLTVICGRTQYRISKILEMLLPLITNVFMYIVHI